MTGPLAVRLFDGIRDQHVTLACPRLSFTKVAPGGHQSAQLRLNLPPSDWPDLSDADRVWIYDKRTGRTVWEGYTNAPGASKDRDAEGFDLSAYGGMSLASDDRRALMYIDRDQNWVRDTTSLQSTRTEWTTRPGTQTQGMLVGFTPGQPVATNNTGLMVYDFTKTDMEFGAWEASLIGGKTDGNWASRQEWTGGGSNSWTLSTGTNPFHNYVGDGVVPAGPHYRFAWGMIRTGGDTTVADDLTWMHISSIYIVGRRKDRNGAVLAGSTHEFGYVYAWQVAEDILGRMLPVCDPAAASITTTTAQINQLTYPEAVSARTVLDDLALWEPDYLWEILHTTGTSKHVFNYRAWPTTARYEITTADGYSRPGTDSGLCNRLVVNYTDEPGNPAIYTATATVPELGSRIRHADPITLPPGRGSLTAATTIGAAVLDDLNAGSDAASAVVRRPLVDLLTGNTVQPWEIEPGYLVRVRETGDLLRLTEVTYTWAEDGGSEASLSLGRPRLTVDQRVARLDRVA